MWLKKYDSPEKDASPPINKSKDKASYLHIYCRCGPHSSYSFTSLLTPHIHFTPIVGDTLFLCPCFFIQDTAAFNKGGRPLGKASKLVVGCTYD